MRTCPTVRLIAIDIDGTLLDSRGRVPDANRDAIAEAVARGIIVALVTGRSFHFARPIVDGLPPDLLLIVNNGALVKALDGATIARWLLARDVARQVLQAAQPFRDGAALVFDRFHHPPVAVERIDCEHPNRRGYFERNRPFVTEVAPLEDALVEDPVQVMFNGPVRAMRELAAHLTAHPAADRFAIALTEYAHRDFSLLDVLTVGCSKGATLADQAARRGIPRDAIMAVGDNLNDREMLAFAGVPVVMGNAAPELRALGWPVTGGHDEEGLVRHKREGRVTAFLQHGGVLLGSSVVLTLPWWSPQLFVAALCATSIHLGQDYLTCRVWPVSTVRVVLVDQGVHAATPSKLTRRPGCAAARVRGAPT